MRDSATAITQVSFRQVDFPSAVMETHPPSETWLPALTVGVATLAITLLAGILHYSKSYSAGRPRGDLGTAPTLLSRGTTSMGVAARRVAGRSLAGRLGNVGETCTRVSGIETVATVHSVKMRVPCLEGRRPGSAIPFELRCLVKLMNRPVLSGDPLD